VAIDSSGVIMSGHWLPFLNCPETYGRVSTLLKRGVRVYPEYEARDLHVGFVNSLVCFGKGESRQKYIEKCLHLDHRETHPDA
jgi:hypothetical protein